MYFLIGFAAFVASGCAFTASALGGESSVCKFRNGYVPVDGVCDAYIECRDFTATEKQCLDGLYFDSNASWPADPCGYPSDVPCKGRSQPAIRSTECEHQYGFYPSTGVNPNDCGTYHMCVGGVAIEMYCPTGLAFNPSISRCDWPENVASCNIENFLGFQCPAGENDDSGNPIVTNHKYEGSCSEFYSCVNGNGRLLSCDHGFAFDARLSRCVRADLVDCKNP